MDMVYYGGVTVLFHPVLHWSIRHLSQNTMGSYVCKSWDEVPYFSLPSILVFYRGVYFFPHHGAGGHWLVQAPLSQQCPIQAWIPLLEILDNVPYAWFGRIPAGGESVVSQLYPIPYKDTFGMPDQGQMLHVCRGQTVESGLRWWAHHIIRIWGGRSATSSPHHHLDAGLHSCIQTQHVRIHVHLFGGPDEIHMHSSLIRISFQLI